MTPHFKRQLRRGLALLLIGSAIWMFIPVMKILFWGIPLCLRQAPRRLLVPVAGVRAAQVADTFGAPRSGGRRHEGVDIFAPRHTPILSPTEGVVLWVGENRLGGRTVRVLGPGAECHYFAHLETYGDLAMGQRIPLGYLLGTVGNSGNARGTPTHLHYGIHLFPHRAINPWMRMDCRHGTTRMPPLSTFKKGCCSPTVNGLSD